MIFVAYNITATARFSPTNVTSQGDAVKFVSTATINEDTATINADVFCHSLRMYFSEKNCASPRQKHRFSDGKQSLQFLFTS